MNRVFKAEEFLDKLNGGTFDGRIHDELLKLSGEQLEQLAMLMSRQLSGDKPPSHREATGRRRLGPGPAELS